MGLGDVARTEHDAGDAAFGQHGGITEKVGPGRMGLAGAAQEPADQRETGIRFQRRTGGEFLAGKGGFELPLRQEARSGSE